MSACGYQKKVAKCNDSVKKMSQVKEGSATALKDRHRRPDKQLYVPRPLRRIEVESISAVKEQNLGSDSSSKQHQSNENCIRNFQSSVNSQTVDQEVCLTKSENRLKAGEKSLDKNNSHHSVVSSSDLVPETKKQSAMKWVPEESFKINVNEHETQCIKNSRMVIDISENCNLSDTEIDLGKKDLKFVDENSSLKDSRNNVDAVSELQHINLKDSESSSQDEPTNFTKRDLDSVDNYSPRIQCEVIKAKDNNSTKQMIVSSAENVADSWETMFNDDGECLDPKFVEELFEITGRIHMTVAKNDYSDYQTPSENFSEEYSNMVELYGFPVEFSTQDLTSAFSFFQESSYNIRWVDDCHALAIFSSPVIANQALHLNHPFIKVRPLCEGIRESKEKARFCARMSEAHKPRPVTSAALARRLVSGALGLKVHTSKEQRDIEKNMLREAREKKKLKAKQRQDIWDGIVS